MEEIIAVSILFVISLFAFIVSIRSFCEKGFLLNNAYIYASKKERAEMDKKAYYRQTGVIFLLMGIVFFLIGLAILLDAGWITYAAEAVILLIVVFAIVSGIAIEKKKKLR